MQLKTWLKHFFVYGFGVILMNAISFIFIPLYTHSISTVEFGVLELFNRSQEALLLVMSFGLRATVLTLYQMEDNRVGRGRLYSTAIFFLLLTGIVITTLSFGGANYLSRTLFGSQERTFEIHLMLEATFAESMFQMAALYLQSAMQSALYMSIFISRAIFSVTLNILLVYYLKMGLRGILIALVIHTTLYALVVTVIVLQKTGMSFDVKRLKSMLHFGLPLVPGALAMFFLNNGDRYFLNIYSTKTSIGIYGLAYKLGTVILTIVLYPFGKIWSVTMVDMGKGPEGPKQLGAVATYLLLISIFFTLALSLLSPYVLHLVATPPYWAAAQLIPIISAAYIFYSWATVMDASFYLTKRTLSKPVILGISFALIFGLYRLLIPRYGSLGAAWATLVGFMAYSLITLFFAQQVFRIEYQGKRITFLFALGITLYLAGVQFFSGFQFKDLGSRISLICLFPASIMLFPFFNPLEKIAIKNSLNKLRSVITQKPITVGYGEGGL